jgi:hypothetical protein
MGINSILIGKGVIIPTRLFIDTFRTQLQTLVGFNKDSEYDDIIDAADKIMSNHGLISHPIGHDAFDARHDMIDVFETEEHAQSLQFIRDWLANNPNDLDSKGNPSNYGAYNPELIFIGQYKEINSRGEFGGRINTSELLYSLGSLLPKIMQYNNELHDLDCSILTNLFEQNVCVWVFAGDCHCCS